MRTSAHVNVLNSSRAPCVPQLGDLDSRTETLLTEKAYRTNRNRNRNPNPIPIPDPDPNPNPNPNPEC